jgi:hypothetical protein
LTAFKGSAPAYDWPRCRTPTPSSLRQSLRVLQVRSMSLSSPTEKRIRPSPIPILFRPSGGISDDVLWPGGLPPV